MPCYSPKGCPTPFYSAGATDKFCLQSIPVIMQYRATLPGVVQPRFICYRIYQSHLQLNSSRHAVLLSHHAEGGEPEDGFAARKALSPIGVGRFAGWQGWWWIGVIKVMKFISITFITTRQQKRRASHAAPPHTPTRTPTPKNKKKNSSSANTWVLVNKYPAPCYSPTVKFAVPSPLRSLTTVFGKGTCVTTSLWAPEKNQNKED